MDPLSIRQTTCTKEGHGEKVREHCIIGIRPTFAFFQLRILLQVRTAWPRTVIHSRQGHATGRRHFRVVYVGWNGHPVLTVTSDLLLKEGPDFPFFEVIRSWWQCLCWLWFVFSFGGICSCECVCGHCKVFFWRKQNWRCFDQNKWFRKENCFFIHLCIHLFISCSVGIDVQYFMIVSNR